MTGFNWGSLYYTGVLIKLEFFYVLSSVRRIRCHCPKTQPSNTSASNPILPGRKKPI